MPTMREIIRLLEEHLSKAERLAKEWNATGSPIRVLANPHGDRATIETVEADPEAMKAICELADRLQVTMAICVPPSFQPSTEWYSQFGFEPDSLTVSMKGEWMQRHPGPPPRTDLAKCEIGYVGSLIARAVGAVGYAPIPPGSGVPWGPDLMGGTGYILTLPSRVRIFLDATLNGKTIYLSQISVEVKGTGIGRYVMNAIHRIAIKHDWAIVVYKVTNYRFFDQFDWLTRDGQDNYIFND